jgi:hypothetical protein
MPNGTTPGMMQPQGMVMQTPGRAITDESHQQRAQTYAGYYNSRFYNNQYGIHSTRTEAPHQFSRTADIEKKQRPIYIGVASVAILFGLFMILSAFSQPKIDPNLRTIIEGAPTREIRAVVFCQNCQGQLESAGYTVIAYYESESAYLIMAKGTDIIPLEAQQWVKRVGQPS